MCERCDRCLPVLDSEKRICDKTKKNVISRNGKANKNSSECYVIYKNDHFDAVVKKDSKKEKENEGQNQ